MKTNLLNFDLPQLTAYFQSIGEKPFRAKQLMRQMHLGGCGDFDAMTDIAKSLRLKLQDSCEIRPPDIVREHLSNDGTRKWLLNVGQGNAIETVFIPEENRGTLCVSTQAGCALDCAFCSTGKQGFNRNLTTAEIIGQLWVANQALGVTPKNERVISNVVMMGMGEPLDNLDEVMKALEIMTAQWGYAWSPKRITLSTVGLKKGLQRFLEESECHLAVSLHAPLPALRRELMPAERAYSITEIVDVLRNYDFSHQRRLSFEYIVFKGVNDSVVYAKELLKLLRGLDCRVNLIRFHAIPNVDLEGVDVAKMTELRDYLTQHGLFTTIRASRGEDIFAACGMLSTAKQEEINKN